MARIEVSEFHVMQNWRLSTSKTFFSSAAVFLGLFRSRFPCGFELHPGILEFRTSFYKGLFFLNTSRDTLAKK